MVKMVFDNARGDALQT